jgi:serine/threonine-protein phosphatase 2A regulatory subunit B
LLKSLPSDDETFLSADDLRINLWHIGINDQSFNIVDIKPENMEELQEVITSAQFHPLHCNIFMYGSSRGSVKLGDMRAAALCDRHTKSEWHASGAVDLSATDLLCVCTPANSL